MFLVKIFNTLYFLLKCSCVYCNQMKDDKADTPTSDTSPRGKKGVKKALKRRAKNEPVASQPPMQANIQVKYRLKGILEIYAGSQIMWSFFLAANAVATTNVVFESKPYVCWATRSAYGTTARSRSTMGIRTAIHSTNDDTAKLTRSSTTGLLSTAIRATK